MFDDPMSTVVIAGTALVLLVALRLVLSAVTTALAALAETVRLVISALASMGLVLGVVVVFAVLIVQTMTSGPS